MDKTLQEVKYLHACLLYIVMCNLKECLASLQEVGWSSFENFWN